MIALCVGIFPVSETILIIKINTTGCYFRMVGCPSKTLAVCMCC